MIDSRYGPVEILVLDDGDQKHTVWCSPADLKKLVQQLDPQPGVFLTIIFEGEHMVRSGYYRKVYLWSEG